MKNVMASFIIILLIGVLSGCASLNMMNTSSHSGHHSSVSAEDANVTNRISSAFVHDSGIPEFNISISTQDGIVTLTGTVANKTVKKRAGHIAANVAGVRSVRNQLRLR